MKWLGQGSISTKIHIINGFVMHENRDLNLAEKEFLLLNVCQN